MILKNWKKKNNENNLIYESSKHVYEFRKFSTIRSFWWEFCKRQNYNK